MGSIPDQGPTISHATQCGQKNLKKMKKVNHTVGSILAGLLTLSPLNDVLWEKLFNEWQRKERGFLGGSMVKNPTANAGDLGSIPG